jgi:hypothetical protein
MESSSHSLIKSLQILLNHHGLPSPELDQILDNSLKQSQNYVMTDGQSASLSWCQTPIWGLRPDFYYCQTVAGLLMWSALSDERTCLHVYNCCWSSPAQSFLGPSPSGLMTIFYSLRFETPPTWNDVLCPFITTRHGKGRKQPLCCWEGLFIGPLPCNGRPLVARVRFVGTCSE